MKRADPLGNRSAGFTTINFQSTRFVMGQQQSSRFETGQQEPTPFELQYHSTCNNIPKTAWANDSTWLCSSCND